MSTDVTQAPDFVAEAQQLAEELRTLRRSIHQHAEIGLDLPKTQQAVLDALSGLDLEITTGQGLSSVVAVLRGAQPGPTVLLRGDMDALPITEANDLEYRSQTDAMHACGHDLHTSGLVGAARLLAAHREQIAGSVIFMFQPGEEGYNGASVMLDEGVLDAAGQRPEAAYAIHVGTGDRGLFMTRPGPMLAGSATVTITLHGKGGHGSTPSSANDPVPALAEIILAAQNRVTRRVNVLDPAVVSITRLWGSDAENVIPEQAGCAGTVRTFSTAAMDLLEEELGRLVRGVAEAHGLRADFEFERGYAVTVNDEQLTSEVEELIRDTFGADRHQQLANPVMGSEDFSFVMQEVPGVYVMLGARPDHIEPGTTYPHSPNVFFDDAVLADQAALMALLAWRHVGR